jgi:hypothetical protein
MLGQLWNIIDISIIIQQNKIRRLGATLFLIKASYKLNYGGEMSWIKPGRSSENIA